ncbi:hypothetical protein ABE137_07285 [Brevibacillus laterosporus]|uniref:hypothetical protein n=1 Tax=Brevibacillus laterosporus TaxID=1465 RepID=UPI003D24D501
MIDQIREYAVIFRKAIQSMPMSEFPKSLYFDRFPIGCCGDSSKLFSKFLSSKGIKAYYVWGIRDDEYSHAWLEYDDIIIDLTADQFDEVHEEVVVTKNRDWHSQFEIQNKVALDFEEFEEYNAKRLGAIYKNILNKINEECMGN